MNLPNYKPKDLMGIPWRLAFALIADGWTLRSRMPGGVEADLVPEAIELRPDVIWTKNAMPESVRDRPSVDFEDVLIFSKSKRYFWDQENGRVALSDTPGARWWRENFDPGKQTGEIAMKAQGVKGGNDGARTPNPAGANMRASWKINTEPTSEEHYASWPKKLVRRLIKIGTSDKGCCPACGAQWVRVIRSETWREVSEPRPSQVKSQIKISRAGWRDSAKAPRRQSLGWRPSCSCGENFIEEDVEDPSYLDSVKPPDPVPCSVLDPFSGIGRTGEVCFETGRRYMPAELSVEYAAIQKRRLADHEAVKLDTEPRRPKVTITGPLFDRGG